MYKFEVFFHEIKERAGILEENLEKLSLTNDPETVHKCRVSIRRISGILRLFNCPDDLMKPIKEIASVLGPIRDIEVQIEFLTGRLERDKFPRELLDDLLYKREILKRDLANSFPEFSKKEFLSKVKNVLRNKAVCKYRIYGYLYKEIQEIIINHPVNISAKELHELRIKLKKIRYTLEALSVNSNDYKEFIILFKKYQDCLGEIHDMDSWLDISNEKMSESGNLKSFLMSRRSEKINEFSETVHEIPSLLGNVLGIAASDLAVEFEKSQDIRSMGYSEDEKLSMAEKLAAELSPDSEHIMRVMEKSIKIFNEVREVMDLDERDILLLKAGALLHDIGYSISDKKHNYHSYELISTSKYLPFSLEERVGISMIAKNHRGKFSIENGLKEILPSKKIRRINRLSSILMAADGMEFESLEYVKEFKISICNREIVFDLGDISEPLAKRFSRKSALLKENFKKDIEKIKRL